MRLEHLKQIMEIDKCRSISQAAKNLFMTQPALSMSLNTIENELGTILFHRNSSGVIPTENEQKIISYIHAILQDIDTLESFVSQLKQEKSTIRLAVIPAIYDALVAKLTVYYQESFPHIQLVITEQSTHDVMDSVINGKCDIGIWGCFADEEEHWLAHLNKYKLFHKHIFRFQFKLFASKDNPLAMLPDVTVADILKETIVEFEGNGHHLLSQLGSFPPKQTIFVGDRETMKKIIAQNGAVAIMSELFQLDDIYMTNGLMCMKNISDRQLTGHVYYLYPQKKALTIEENHLLTFLTDFLKPINHS